tara:strand:+ start:296 stop:523 length:228 start_codon:yes stop_codon:yes gene_type:complete
MPKFLVKDGLIDKFVGAIFGSIGKQVRSAAIKNLSAKDPQFAKKVKDLEKQRKDMESYIKKNKKELQKRYPHAGF